MKELENKIINGEISNQDTAEIMYLSRRNHSKLPLSVTTTLFMKDRDRLDEIDNLENEYERNFERIKENYKNKILSKKYLKLIVKDILKDKQVKMSQTSIMEMLAVIDMDIIDQVCFHTLKNEICDELLDLLFELKNNQLKDEYTLFLNTLVKKMAIKTSMGVTDDIEYHVYIFVKEFGKYLSHVYFKENNNLEIIKDNINKILNYSDKEVQINKKKYDDSLDGYTSEVKEQFSDLAKEIIENQFNKLEEELDYKDDPDYELYLNKFNKYFNYDNHQDMKDYYEIVKNTDELSNDKEIDFQDALEIMLINTEDRYHEENEPDEEDAEHMSIIMAQYFVILLAYHLHNGQELDENKKKELVNEFIHILINNEKCKENYNHELKSNLHVPFLFKFSPIDTYYNRIISSVLFELNNKKIAKEVLNILNKYFGKKNKNDLVKLINEQTKEYNESDYVTLLAENKIHEYAISFIYYYLKDKAYMAPYAPFSRYVDEILVDHLSVDYMDKNELIDAIITSNKQLDEEYVHGIRQANQVLESILNTEEDEKNLFDQEKTKYLMLIQEQGYDMSHFLEIDNINVMLEKHKHAIINQLRIYIKHFDFENKTYQEQMDILWQLAIQLEVLSEIERTNNLIPTLESLEKDETIKKLNKENKGLNHNIKNLNNEIKKLEKEIHKVKSNTKEVIQKEVNNISQSHNIEVLQLNKKINELENKIQELNENSNELFKLREYIFNMNNEDIEIIEDNYDLSEVIKDKSIVIIGGHIHLMRRLKEKYNNIVNIQNENQITSDIIKYADHVFIFTNFQSHGKYYRTMNFLNRYGTKWDYMDGVNLDRVEKDMYLKLVK